MPAPAVSVSRHPPVADLLRMAVPVALIAVAVAATLWIDRSAPTSGEAASETSAVASH